MSIYMNQDFLVENSRNELYRFYLTNDHKIKYDLIKNNSLKQSKILLEKTILDYAIDVDEQNKIHLLCITREGDLLYFIFNNEKWIKNTISRFNVQSNKYKYLTLKIVNGTIHIFYSYCNVINQNIWTLQHIIGRKGKWERKNILTINAGRYISPFYIDFDSENNIHLVFKEVSKGIQHIYYTSFSSFLNRWYSIPQKLSEVESDNSHPYMFVDTKNNIHILWCTMNNGDLRLVYKQMPFIESNTYKWRNINIPLIKGNISQPLMFEDDGILKIVVKYNGELRCLYSVDGGYNWEIDNFIQQIDAQNAKLIEYSCSSPKKYQSTKINHIYGRFEKGLILFFYNNNNISNFYDSISNEESNSTKLANSINNDNFLENQGFSIINQFNTFNDDDIKEFISNIKLELNSVLSKTEKMHNIKNQIEKIIYKNAKKLNSKIISNKGKASEIIQELSTLENIIKEYKTENDTFIKMLSDIREKYEKNSVEISSLVNQLHEIKEIVEKTSKSKILDKIINFFK